MFNRIVFNLNRDVMVFEEYKECVIGIEEAADNGCT
jgi:hypothetical protein